MLIRVQFYENIIFRRNGEGKTRNNRGESQKRNDSRPAIGKFYDFLYIQIFS
jgi:hypothetical protein